jgi:glucose-6-phosphate isomerase
MKIDSNELFKTNSLFEVPPTYSEREKEILERFMESSDAKSDKKQSSYRTAAAFKLDLDKSLALAKSCRDKFSTLIVLGTGGSSLGTKAIVDALKPKIDREIFFLENLDATDIPKSVDLKKTAVVAISKSGNTLETLLALQYYVEKYSAAGLKLSEHFVAISDKGSKAPLAAWAKKNEVPVLDMDVLLGGRWSVTSAVGAFPLAFCGVDVNKFLGALEKRFAAAPEKEVLKLALRFADFDEAYNVHSLWLYSSRLKEIGAWWKQLWSESLGKKKGSGYVGAFACPATGAVDQHSVLQQMAEGRPDAYTGFIFVKNNSSNIEVKNLDADFATKIGFSQGKNWHQLLQTQGLATLKSLQQAGRPTYSLTIENITEESLGDLMGFWMDVTSLVGAAFQVNPFDQPGVEHGKKLLPTLF